MTYNTLVPIPCICGGTITSHIKDSETYEVQIHKSPIGEFLGPISARLIYQPGTQANYKKGDYVKAMVHFTFGGHENKFLDVHHGGNHHILGMFSENSVADIRVDNPVSAPDSETISLIHNKSGAGVVATSNGKTTLSSGGSIYHALSPFGYGIDKNMSRSVAQNHQRVVSHNPPFYTSKEHFGMYSGKNANEEASKVSDTDYYIIYRRFVSQTRDVENWVSTCEGTWAPWVGPNNSSNEIEKTKNVLFTKIVNAGASRATIEIGESGKGFFSLRIDDVKINERHIPESSGATPALIGNKFKLEVGEDGAVSIRTSGAGIPGPIPNTNGTHISISASGDLTIHSKGKITLSHGPSDHLINSITMDPVSGIDLMAVNGVRVNGQPVVLDSFIKWMAANQLTFTNLDPTGLVAPIPLPMYPTAIASFNTLMAVPGITKGFTSIGIGPPAIGLISDADLFISA